MALVGHRRRSRTAGPSPVLTDLGPNGNPASVHPAPSPSPGSQGIGNRCAISSPGESVPGGDPDARRQTSVAIGDAHRWGARTRGGPGGVGAAGAAGGVEGSAVRAKHGAFPPMGGGWRWNFGICGRMAACGKVAACICWMESDRGRSSAGRVDAGWHGSRAEAGWCSITCGKTNWSGSSFRRIPLRSRWPGWRDACGPHRLLRPRPGDRFPDEPGSRRSGTSPRSWNGSTACGGEGERLWIGAFERVTAGTPCRFALREVSLTGSLNDAP